MDNQQREYGFLQHFDASRGKGFGFILPDNSHGQSNGLFFHIANFERDANNSYIELNAGDRLSFVRGTGKNGREQAHRVRLEPDDKPQGEQGTVREWTEKGYGFLVSDSGQSFFAHSRNVLLPNGDRKLAPGQRVWFQLRENPRTKQIQAVNVSLISGEDEQKEENQ